MTSSQCASIPRADGLPAIGCAAALVRDPLGFLRTQHAKHGPIFEIKVPGRRIVVLAGREANRFFATAGREALSGEAFWGRLAAHNDCPHLMLALEGDDHRRLRRHYAESLSQATVQRFASQLETLTCDMFTEARGSASLQDFMRHLVSRQAHLLLARGDAAIDHATLRALMESFRYQSNVLLLGKWPRAAFALPRHRANTRRVDEMVEHLLATTREHTQGWFAAAHAGAKAMPELFTPGDLRFSMTLPFVLGVDTVGSTLAFMARELLRDPSLSARVREQVDAAFAANAGALPSIDALRKIDDLSGLVFETMRLYPAAFGVSRTAAKDFEFEGHAIKRGAEVLMFTTGSHVDAKLFPRPYAFDVERVRGPRSAYRQKHAFAPYGGGPHVCLGIGMGEALLLLTAGLLLHRFDLTALDSAGAYTAIYDPSLAVDTRGRFSATARVAPTLVA